jgi:hypothetical protein
MARFVGSPCPWLEIEDGLSCAYGLPVDASGKLAGLAAVSRALDEGEVVKAQIVALHLRFPDLPSIAKFEGSSPEDQDSLAHRLRASGLLKANWDPSFHPRWPAGSPAGGQFASGGGTTSDSTAHVTSTQAATLPMDIPLEEPRIIPFPSELVPPPIITPREVPKNPYPNRADCAEEWAAAADYCGRLLRSGKLGRGDQRGMGKSYRDCLLGQVSERCGDNPVA